MPFFAEILEAVIAPENDKAGMSLLFWPVVSKGVKRWRKRGDRKAWRDTIAAGHLNRDTPSDPTGHLFSEFLQSLFSSYLSCLLKICTWDFFCICVKQLNIILAVAKE